MTTIIQTGTKYDLYDSSIQTHQSLPAGIYKVTFNPQSYMLRIKMILKKKFMAFIQRKLKKY